MSHWTETSRDRARDSALEPAADRTSFEGVRTALAMAGVRVHNAATGVDKTIKTMTEGGYALQALSCNSYFDQISSELRRLEAVLKDRRRTERDLAPEVKRLNGAFDGFASTWVRAQRYFEAHPQSGEKLDKQPAAIQPSLEALNELVGLSFHDADTHDTSVDIRRDGEILAEMLRSNIEAMRDTAESVRIRAAADQPADLPQDASRMIHHAAEIAAQLNAIATPTVEPRSLDKPLLAAALAEVRAVEAEAAAHPALAAQLAGSNLASSLSTIRTKGGVK